MDDSQLNVVLESFIFNEIDTTDSSNADETTIHEFLDHLNINQVNIKETCKNN